MTVPVVPSSDLRIDSHTQPAYPATLSTCHGHQAPVDSHLITFSRHLAKLVIDQPAKRVELLVTQVEIERFVHLADRDPRVDQRLPLVEALDRLLFVLV